MLGPHIIGDVSPHLDVIRRWQPRLLLLLDPSSGAAQAIKRVSPNTIIIGRVWKADGEIANRITANPVEAAQWGASLIRLYAAGNPEVDYWQFTNEIQQGSVTELQRLNTHSIAFVDALAAMGLKAAIGGFGVGNPKTPQEDPAQWAAFYPAMRHAKAKGGILLIHAYGADKIFEPNVNWYLYRYEYRVLPYLPNDLKDMPYAYGEYGCDMGVKVVGDRRGWKTGYGGNWNAYGADLLAASRFLAGYPQCKGAAIFTLGQFGDWGDFDIAGGCAEHLAGLAWAQPVEQPIPPPLPVPVPPTGGNMTLTDRFIQLARAEFGDSFEDLRATLPKHPTLRFDPIDSRLMRYLCFHHSATPINTTWLRVAQAHINERDFAGVGYHLGIRLGKVALLGDLDTVRAHVLNRNDESLGICVMGNYDTGTLSAENLDTMKRLVKVLDALYDRDKDITSHRDMLGAAYTACPGSDIKRVLSTLREVAPVPPPLAYTDEERAKAKWFTEQLARTLRGDPDATATLISALISEPKKAGLHNVLVEKALPSLERA